MDKGNVCDGCLPPRYPSSPSWSSTDGPSGRGWFEYCKATVFKILCPTFLEKARVPGESRWIKGCLPSKYPITSPSSLSNTDGPPSRGWRLYFALSKATLFKPHFPTFHEKARVLGESGWVKKGWWWLSALKISKLPFSHWSNWWPLREGGVEVLFSTI